MGRRPARGAEPPGPTVVTSSTAARPEQRQSLGSPGLVSGVRGDGLVSDAVVTGVRLGVIVFAADDRIGHAVRKGVTDQLARPVVLLW